MKKRKLSAILLLISIFLFNQQTYFAFSPPPAITEHRFLDSEKFWRTELYFGADRPDGSEVTDDEWNRFLSEEITPRFPEGFTVLEAFGQFRDASGKIVREKSRCLILLYSKKMRKANHGKIEEIRQAYKKSFQQESVLRVDFRQTVQVSF